MFLNKSFNYEEYAMICLNQFGLSVQWDWALDFFGGWNPESDFMHASNIIFSNGSIDPWFAGSIVSNVSDSCIAFTMEKAAHHLDLKLPHENDPQSVVDGRNIERMWIKKWIDEYYE